MANPFFKRLKDYFADVGQVLQGKSTAASIFPNPTDIGMSRERVYAEVLKQHVPSSCNVLFGGFLFGMEGDESNQIDLIITNDQSPQFNFYNPDGSGKSFACVDGSIAIAALKSNLTSPELQDALKNISSIPNKRSIERKVNPMITVPYAEDWPLKIIYATDGVSPETALGTIEKFYQSNPAIPVSKKPNIIHVAGKYVIVRAYKNETTRDGRTVPENAFYCMHETTDVFGLMWTIFNIQRIALSQNQILYSYIELIDHIDF